MRKSFLLPIAFFVAITLESCSKNESITEPAANSFAVPSNLSGGWAVLSATLDGVDTSFVALLHRPSATTSEYVTFGEDGSYYVGDYGPPSLYDEIYSESGQLRVNGQRFTLTITYVNGNSLNPVIQRSGQWEAIGDNLTLTYSEGGELVAIRYIRVTGRWDY